MENKTPMQELKKRLFDVNINQNPLTLKETNSFIEKEKQVIEDFTFEVIKSGILLEDGKISQEEIIMVKNHIDRRYNQKFRKDEK